jgi:hypothetical protein
MGAMLVMWRSQASARHGAVAFALLALFVQLLAPPGFMVGRQGDHAAIVICTGHGPASALADLGHPGKAPKSRHDAPCVFSGHAGGAGPSPVALIARPIAISTLAVAAARFDLTPGRGLAAPPPPSQGPPQPTL